MGEQEIMPNQAAPTKTMDRDNLPKSANILNGIDCDASPVPVLVTVELPFWLMVPDGEVVVTVQGAKFAVEINESYVDIFVGEVSDSRRTALYNGPISPKGDLIGQAAMSGASLMFRKAKTVLKIASECSSDALSAMAEGSKRRRIAYYYFVSFCSAHLPIVNRLIEAYRWATADAMAATVTPRSVPVWRIRNDKGEGFLVHLLPEAGWDYKPTGAECNDRSKPNSQTPAFAFADLETLANAVSEIIEPSELALLDAHSFLHRGDYSGAVRRAVTALEVLLERQLQVELTKVNSASDVEDRLRKSRNDFSGRLRQYENLSARSLGTELFIALEDIRNLRHEIVHRGRLMTYGERGIANHAVDTGRFIYNWLENDSASVQRRESRLAQKALGGVDLDFFQAEILADGVRVKRPSFWSSRNTTE